MWGDIAIAFMLAFLTTFVITPYTIKLAKKLGAVDTQKDERRVSGKSLLGVLSLGVVGGTTIKIIADGPDEKDATEGIVALVESGFTGM